MGIRKRHSYTQEYFEELLRGSGYKITPARLNVLDILARAGRPLSAGDIHERLCSSRRTLQINYVTVYRSLNSFESDALIRRVPLERDSNYYELADKRKHHFICTQCGHVELFSSSLARQLECEVRKAGGAAIERYSIQVYGVCKKCAPCT